MARALQIAALGMALLGTGCQAGYVASSAYFQAELLWSRRPISEVRATEPLTSDQLRALDWIAQVKAWGAGRGFASTDNYDTIAWNWDRTIWNVTGCDPVAFEPKTWWFPVAGRFPYLGFFREADARAEEARLQAAGLDTYVRTAGAYSTLGWFRDPVLPGMLGWGEFDLADTVLHELAHATLWIPGSVSFNESFANFVGEQAAYAYLADTHGTGSEELREARVQREDRRQWGEVLHGVAAELDVIYADARLDRDAKLRRKAEVFASLPERARSAPLHEPERYVRAALKTDSWNNARLIQYRVYNTHHDRFAALLAAQNGDLLRFIDAVQRLTQDAEDPFVALESATSNLVPSVVSEESDAVGNQGADPP